MPMVSRTLSSHLRALKYSVVTGTKATHAARKHCLLVPHFASVPSLRLFNPYSIEYKWLLVLLFVISCESSPFLRAGITVAGITFTEGSICFSEGRLIPSLLIVPRFLRYTVLMTGSPHFYLQEFQLNDLPIYGGCGGRKGGKMKIRGRWRGHRS